MTRGPIVITTAVVAEAGPLIRQLGLRRDMRVLDDAIAHTGSPNGQQVVLVVTGMGRERARRIITQTLERCRPRAVIMTGFAGAANPNLTVGDVVVPVIIDDEQSGQRYKPTIFADGLGQLHTATHIVSTVAEKALCFNNGADAVDMETAAMAAACEAAGVRWLAVRAISDAAHEDLPAYLMKLTKPDGRADLGAAIMLAITRPRSIGRLIRLGKAAKLASEALAKRVIGVLRQLG